VSRQKFKAKIEGKLTLAECLNVPNSDTPEVTPILKEMEIISIKIGVSKMPQQ